MTDISLWLSAGAFGISIVSLYFSIRKQVFDEEIATADQAAVLISKLGETKVLTLKYRERIAALRRSCLQCGKVTSDVFDLYEKCMDLVDNGLDHDMQEMTGSTHIPYRSLKLKQGELDSKASVLSYVTAKMDEMIAHCVRGKECEQSAAPLPPAPQTGPSAGAR